MANKAKEALQTQAADATAEVADGTTAEADPNEKPVRTLIREAWAEGKSRSEIAKMFGVTYQRVFSLTRDTEGGPGESQGRARVMVAASDELTKAGHEDLVGLPRVEAARQLWDGGNGLKVGAIAKLLGTTYQIIYQATAAKAKGEDDEAAEGQTDESSEDEPNDVEPSGEAEEGSDADEV